MKKQLLLIFAILFLSFVALLANNTRGDPVGTTIMFNSTLATPTIVPANKSDAGGTINLLSLNVIQQDQQWKAYVGNVSGTLTLDDTSGNSIYQWALTDSSITGEVYASRASTITWSSINCSTGAIVSTEETALGMNSSAADSIYYTFNETTHSAVTVAGRTIGADTCNVTATYVNDTRQVPSAAYFPLILMSDGANLVYSTIIRQNVAGFNTVSLFDFQMIVADIPTQANTTYFFYAEIG